MHPWLQAWENSKARNSRSWGRLYDITSAFRSQRVRWQAEHWPNPIEARRLREHETRLEERFQESMHNMRTEYDGRLRWAERVTR